MDNDHKAPGRYCSKKGKFRSFPKGCAGGARPFALLPQEDSQRLYYVDLKEVLRPGKKHYSGNLRHQIITGEDRRWL